jgi:perosamine synthetase
MSKLALLGGDPCVTLDYNKVGKVPVVAERAYKTVEDLMRKGEISTSPIVGQFEKRFAEYIGTTYALAAVNGTTTIQEALFAVGVKPGDEVIVPSYTFWASALPIVANGATPVFCDVLEDTHCLDPKSVESLITPKTKAIVVVHVWGTPADMDAIMDIAKRHNLKVVEDASHAHGAMYKGKKVGSIGDVGCFSMQESKTLPAGEAGMLVTSNKTYYERACALGHYERLGKLVDSPYSQFSLTALGFKHRVHPIAIGIADANLDHLDEYNAIRSKYGKMLEDGIADLDFIVPQKVEEGNVRNFAYHYVRYIPEKFGNIALTTFLTAVAKEGVVCGSCGYGKLHTAPVFTNKEQGEELTLFNPAKNFHCDYDLPVTRELAENTFMIAPRFEKECDELVKQYIAAYHKIAENKDALVEYQKEHEIKVQDNAGRSINLFK